MIQFVRKLYGLRIKFQIFILKVLPTSARFVQIILRIIHLILIDDYNFSIILLILSRIKPRMVIHKIIRNHFS